MFALKKSLESPGGRSGISEIQQDRPILGNKRTAGRGDAEERRLEERSRELGTEGCTERSRGD